MNRRRQFLQFAGAAAAPVMLSSAANAADGNAKDIVGAWITSHSLDFPPFSFREILGFGEGGVLNETNSFLHTNSSLDLSVFKLPTVVNASDGIGSWERVGNGQFRISFRKLLFDGTRNNFADLRVTGLAHTDGSSLLVNWPRIEFVDLTGQVLYAAVNAVSRGTRIAAS